MAGDIDVCLWINEYLDSMVEAGFQPNIPDDIFIHLVKEVKGDDRSRVDQH